MFLRLVRCFAKLPGRDVLLFEERNVELFFVLFLRKGFDEAAVTEALELELFVVAGRREARRLDCFLAEERAVLAV